jgi:hypothetical protein
MKAVPAQLWICSNAHAKETELENGLAEATKAARQAACDR